MKTIICACLLIYCLALILFINGFMPIKTSSFKFSEPNSIATKISWRNETSYKYDKVVLIIIDAFRADFLQSIVSHSNYSMPRIEHLLKEHKAFGFLSRAQTPTVTLPRIKSMITGKITSFIDMIYNFNAYSLKEDNVIYQASKHNKRIVFYGDDTWTRLFPTSFLRSDGTTSFFVSDFTEVDNNVTRHIDSELKSLDWDLLILHYLGVDHIGHSHTPSSNLMQKKLMEMDDIIFKIYLSLKESNQRSLLLVTGDHGMTHQGNHGGPSDLETLTPLVMIHTHSWGNEYNATKDIQQIDIAPTLAAALDIPIPYDSIGSAVPIFDSREQQVNFYNYNAIHLCNKMSTKLCQQIFQASFKMFNSLSKENVNHTIDLTLKTFQASNQKARDMLLSQDAHYNMTSFLTAIVSAFLSVMTLSSIFLNPKCIKLNKKLAIVLACITLAALYFSNICRDRHELSLMACMLVLFFSNYAFKINFSPKRLLNWQFLSAVIHTLSFLSSSYIEEEHLVWNYLTATSFFIYMLKKRCPSWKVIASLAIFRILIKWNSTGYQWLSAPDISDWLLKSENTIVNNALLILSLLVIALVMQKYTKSKLSLCLIVFHLVILYSYKMEFLTVPYLEYASLLFLICCKQPLIIIWVLWITYLHRTVNIVLIAGQLLISHLIPGMPAHLFWHLAMSGFFLQGNSNNISTLDFAMAFAGLKFYQPILVGFQLISLTYSAPILWLILFSYQFKTDQWNLILLQRSFTNLLYLCIVLIHRYHLFIWSVFAPKLLYECSLSCLLYLMYIIVCLVKRENVFMNNKKA